MRIGPSGPLTSNGGGAVDSVFGRTGVVIAENGDYNSSQITNNSLISGSNVSEALNALSTSYLNGKFTDGAIRSPGDIFILDPISIDVSISVPSWELIHDGGPAGIGDAILPPQSLIGKVIAFQMAPLFQALTNNDPIEMKISLNRYNSINLSNHLIDLGIGTRQSAFDSQTIPVIIITTIDLRGLTSRDECQLYFKNEGGDLLRATSSGSYNMQGQG